MLSKPVNKTKKRKALIKACDKLWSAIVKERADMACEICGKVEHLNSHHIITRSDKVLRWHIHNGLSLCAGCHTLSSKLSAHKSPFAFVEWFNKKFPFRYEKLKMMKGKPFKTNISNMELVKLYLEQEAKK